MSKKIITNKQHTILILLLTFRFVNSKQIQQFLHHKDHRRINSWLKDLVAKEYIDKHFKPVFGTLTKPAVYNLTAKGRAYLKSSYPYHFPKYLKRISRDSKASKGLRSKLQIIADWYLIVFSSLETPSHTVITTLVRMLKTNVEEEEKDLLTNTFSFFTPSYYPSFPLLETTKPDAYIRYKTTQGITHGLLFVVDAYVPRVWLRYVFKKIFTHLEEAYWETDDIALLHIYFLCPNNMVIIYMKRLLNSFLERYYGGKELIFHFGTRNQLYKRRETPAKKIKWIVISSEDDRW